MCFRNLFLQLEKSNLAIFNSHILPRILDCVRGLVSALGGIRAGGGSGDGLTVAVGRLLVRGAGASGGAVVAVAAAVVVIIVAIGHSHLTVVHLVDVAPQVASEWRMPDSKRNRRLRVND